MTARATAALDLDGESRNANNERRFLFLQGPITPFFRDLASRLEAAGCRCYRINLCFGDWLFWRGRESVQYRGRQKNWPAYIAQFLDEHRITELVLLGEQRYYHRVAIEEAQLRGIQVVTTDFGYLRPDWITFEKNGMSANSQFRAEAGEILELAKSLPSLPEQPAFKDSFFRQVCWDMQYHLLSTLFRPFYPGYRSHQIYHPIFVYLGTGLRLLLLKLYGERRARATIARLRRTGEPYVVFPLQMQNDFQIRAYSKYDSIQQALDEVVESFARNAPADMRLVVKIHPLDPGLVNWSRYCRSVARRHAIAERLVFIDGGSLDDLLESAHGVVTINSTVGIWALRQHKPLCVLGEALYRIPGLVSEQPDAFWRELPQPAPGLADAFLRTIASYLHVRGVYYRQPGLANAVEEAARRLLADAVNRPMPPKNVAETAAVA